MKKKRGKHRTRRRTRLDVAWDRKDLAVRTLFCAGFDVWEVAALLRRSEGIVLDVLRHRR